MINKKVFFVLHFLLLFFVFRVDAATISLLPQNGRTFAVGQEFNVDLKINTEEEFINAVQATVRFPSDVLELTSVLKTDSVFSFWPDEPEYSNENGTMKFIGGGSKGIAGDSLQVLRMKFKAKALGVAELTLLDAVITASDGKGTNVLGALKGTNISVGVAVAGEPLPIKLPDTGEVAPFVEVPQKIIREPVVAKTLPPKPKLRVPLYPDESRWYNHLGETIVFWDLSPDVLQVSTRLSRAPNEPLGEGEKELFTGKNFGILEEGIWYVRIQFRNSVGWGEVSRYKIAIDTVPPQSLEIKMDQLASDNPSREIRYETYDSLSGISHALIFLDKKEFLKSTTTLTKLVQQSPGKHSVVVRIFDLAGNSVEDSLEFEILPLPMPNINFITKTISEDEFAFVSGKGLPNAFIDIRVLNTVGQEIFRGTATTDSLGGWESIIDRSFQQGKYSLSVVSRDERGAKSYPTYPVIFRVNPKTIISLGFLNLGWFEIFIILFLVTVSGVSLLARHYISQKKTREAYRVIVGRDIEKLGTILSNHLRELDDLNKIEEPSRSARMMSIVNKMKDTIASMKKYLGEEVEKL